MKTFALFVSILVGYLAARNVKDSDPKGFVSAVSDAIEEFETQIAERIQAVDYSLSSAGSRLPLQFGVDVSPQFGGGVLPPSSVSFGTPYDTLIVSSSNAAGIPPDLLYRLLNQESRFRPDIISGATRSRVGALGIAQFMPDTAREWLGSEAAALDPNKAIPGAAKYLAWLIRQFSGNVKAAVAAYNWGIGNVKKKGLDNAPLETRNYVAAILPGQSIG
jgi:soluble lytic murein transglycosylase-like protein